MKFKVNFTLYPNVKTVPVFTGYRPTWCATSKPEHNSGMIQWSGDRINLGETREVILSPFAPEFWNKVAVNDILKCMEGSREVGEATILEILPDVPVV